MSIPLAFVIAMIVATVGLGVWATKKSSTASDFFVAGRSVSVFWNASAISGEYLSAASFMGVAGLVMKFGYDALWYPVGYAAGYLLLLLFIAGPLRRFGAYTIPDFAQGRFDSPMFRKVAVVFVLCIGFFYTMPQMKGAGLTLSLILNWPYWAGVFVVGGVITFNVVTGGMKGITLVQAMQYWAKLFAIAIPFFVLASIYGPASALPLNTKPPIAESSMVLKLKGAAGFPANIMTMPTSGTATMTFPKGAKVKATPAISDPKKASMPPVPLVGDLKNTPWDMSGPAGDTFAPGSTWTFRASTPEKGLVANSWKIEFQEATEVTLEPGSAIPNAPPTAKWENPFGPMTSKQSFPLLYTYSLIIALVCGTAGLPHILVRFYTNPDGRAAKKTTLWVMVMLGVFYVFTPMWGTLGRHVSPEFYANNSTDILLLKLPLLLENKLLGQILSGITSAGAFAAFMSTFSGLLISMSSAFAHDIYGRILRPASSSTDRLKAFKVAAVVVGIISMSLGLVVESFDIATMVGWAFAIGAASYFPLLLLGSWWRGLTAAGAASGMLLGGLLSLAAIITNMMLDKKVLVLSLPPLVRLFMEQPAIWGVPLSMITMWLVSTLTKSQIPKDVDMKMLRLHAPEELGYSKNYIEH